ncbi:MAG: phosphate-binding protein [Herpetosiphonaceae bacterium]|nr:MAG: phosphate-binding protein [Herpetosiphonaceae bacterium]
MRRLFAFLSASLLLTLLAACGQSAAPTATTATGQGGTASPTATTAAVNEPEPTNNATDDLSHLSGDIVIDGSSTVFPISEAVAEEFGRVAPNVRVTVGVSGTGGGFKRFCAGETAISDASRPIKDSEIAACEEQGVEFIELPVAYDGLSVMVNPENDWVECMTPEELKQIWAPEAQGTITNWNQIRPDWPDQPLSLYGPGTDSGTFDYFTDAIVGEEGASRGDYTASEDDNVLVQGIAGEKNALGYFGYAYYIENQDKLKLVAIDGGQGCIAPSDETINNGSYYLSRPIFIYVRKDALDRPEVAQFVEFYLENAPQLVSEVGYVPLPEEAYQLAKARVENRTTGTTFSGAEGTVVELLKSK